GCPIQRRSRSSDLFLKDQPPIKTDTKPAPRVPSPPPPRAALDKIRGLRQGSDELLHGSADDARQRRQAGIHLIFWCKEYQHRVEPDPAEQAQRYGDKMPVPEWRERLV
ncbi:MAG: hypothetical protein JO358_16690, partial [Alphaproteobacteria bacterium]|nr:hypothetical protein [Alphaproteobacteria bacterium]